MWNSAPLTAVAALLLDLATKSLALSWLAEPPHTVPVLPVFSFTLGFNSGISFGLLAGGSSAQVWALSVVGILIVGILVWLTTRSKDRVERIGYALIIGGAVGNLIDRLGDGTVTDFLDFHVGEWRFPTFNLADTAITLGVGLILLLSLVVQRDGTVPSKDAPP